MANRIIRNISSGLVRVMLYDVDASDYYNAVLGIGSSVIESDDVIALSPQIDGLVQQGLISVTPPIDPVAVGAPPVPMGFPQEMQGYPMSGIGSITTRWPEYTGNFATVSSTPDTETIELTEDVVPSLIEVGEWDGDAVPYKYAIAVSSDINPFPHMEFYVKEAIDGGGGVDSLKVVPIFPDYVDATAVEPLGVTMTVWVFDLTSGIRSISQVTQGFNLDVLASTPSLVCVPFRRYIRAVGVGSLEHTLPLMSWRGDKIGFWNQDTEEFKIFPPSPSLFLSGIAWEGSFISNPTHSLLTEDASAYMEMEYSNGVWYPTTIVGTWVHDTGGA